MQRKFVVGVICSVMGLSACMMGGHPSQLKVNRITVEQSTQSIVFERDEITSNILARVADDYKRTSEGGMDVFVSYPQDLRGAEAEANRLASEYKAILNEKGVHHVSVSSVPMNSPEFDSRVVIAFKGYKAKEPEDCTRISGRRGAETMEYIDSYEIGCEHMRYVSKMVSDPRDLLGRSGTPDADARRAGNIVERYRTGEEFEPLETSGASSIGE